MTLKLYQSVPGICELIATALWKAGIDFYLGAPPASFDPTDLKEELRSHPLDRQIWGIFVQEEDIDRGLEIIQVIAPLTHKSKNKTFFIFVTEDLPGEIKNG